MLGLIIASAGIVITLLARGFSDVAASFMWGVAVAEFFFVIVGGHRHDCVRPRRPDGKQRATYTSGSAGPPSASAETGAGDSRVPRDFGDRISRE